MCDVCRMNDIIIHVVNRVIGEEGKLTYGQEVKTNCGIVLKFTKAAPWHNKKNCAQCLKKFLDDKPKRAYTLTEVEKPIAQEAQKTPSGTP